MEKSQSRAPLNLFAALVLIGAVLVTAFAMGRFGLFGPGQEMRSGYRRVLDSGGNLLFCTSLPVNVGDQFIGPSDELYTIREVGADDARAVTVLRQDSPVDLPQMVGAAGPGSGESAMPLGLASRAIVIYHTHTDESYEPTDGRASVVGSGGIIAVGDSLSRSLQGVGYAVVHDKTSHLPHDALAYARSRRTAYASLKYRPYLIFDVHRDSGPADTYITTVAGQQVSQVMLVVGRQNPLLKANLEVARKIKSAADASYPGLIKGIFLATSHYNQDLDPGALLIEVGTEKVPRELAERSMAFFAQAIARAFGAPGI